MAKIACLHCDLLVNAVDIDSRESAICPRCHQKIYFGQQSFSTSIALLLTALLVYFPAIFLPFLSLQALGPAQEISLFQSITIIAHDDLILLALVVFVLVLFLPFVKFFGLLSLIVPLSRGRLPFRGSRSGISMARLLLKISPWCMTEVYLVGALVTLVKLMGMATINFSNGFFAFILLIFVNAYINFLLPQQRIWQAIAILKVSPQSSEIISDNFSTDHDLGNDEKEEKNGGQHV